MMENLFKIKSAVFFDCSTKIAKHSLHLLWFFHEQQKKYL
jgi:hypothetical protein